MKNMQKIAIGLVLTIVLISGCAGPKSVPKPEQTIGAQGTTVDIKGSAFDPNTISISNGTTVTWTNRDSIPHTVTGDDFDSGPISQGMTFSQTFKETGKFEYHCTIHTRMTGTVIVT